jgi:hypothetical protein
MVLASSRVRDSSRSQRVMAVPNSLGGENREASTSSGASQRCP